MPDKQRDHREFRHRDRRFCVNKAMGEQPSQSRQLGQFENGNRDASKPRFSDSYRRHPPQEVENDNGADQDDEKPHKGR